MKVGRRQSVLLAIVLCLLAAGFSGVSRSEGTTKVADAKPGAEETTNGSQKQPIISESDKNGSTLFTPISTNKLAAENNKYQMFIDEAIGQVRIRDKMTGIVWFGTPQVDQSTPPNNLKFIADPVSIRYTGGKSSVSTYPSKENAIVTTNRIDGGIRFDFSMDTIGISFSMEYRLTNSGMEATIPFQSIKETASNRITSLEVLPFFEAADPQSTGALFIPDGSGAIIKFKQIHPPYFDNFSQFIYGGDPAFQTKVYEQVTQIQTEFKSYGPREKVALPVFGLYKDNKAFLAIVTQGDSDAKINATPSGARNINLYRTSAEFIYRNDDIIFVGKSGEIPIVEGNMIGGDRSVRYVLLQNDKANYVGMAQTYRDYLMSEKGVKAVQHNDANLQLRLFGGVLRNEIIGQTFITMTSFEQAKTIVDGFLAKGVTSIEVTYDGWSSGGKYGNQPEHFPAAGKIGGNDALSKLANYLNEKGIRLYLNANYVKPFNESSAVRPSRDAIRGLNKEVLKVFEPYVTTRQSSGQMYYFLKPDRVYDKFISKEAEQYAKFGISGVHLDYMGETVYSDQEKQPAFRRAQTIKVWNKSMDLMRQKTGHASVDYGFAYTLSHVDRIDNIPLDSSHYTYEDESVPFYQIAIHGLIPYSAEPSNLRDDPRIDFLRMMEYGAMPSYELTYENSAKLKRTKVDDLFSSAYQDWVELSVDEYKKAIDALNAVADKAIINHEQLEPHVYRTTYEGGTQVIVNYNRNKVTINGQVVDPYGYAVRKGGSGQ